MTDRAVRCGHCKKPVLKSRQPNGKFFIYQDKAICVTCRALHFSKASASAMGTNAEKGQKADKSKKEAQQNREEKSRIGQIAEASQKKTNTKKHGST